MSVTENTEPKINMEAAVAAAASAKTVVCDEAHQRRLAKRREYYQQNREHIRERDNASARLNREKYPERYRCYVEACKLRAKARAAPPFFPPETLEHNPDRERILERIAMEKEGRCNEQIRH